MLNEGLGNGRSFRSIRLRSNSLARSDGTPNVGCTSAGAPTTLDFSVSILDDWALVTVVLGILLSMAMIGASYLVRDERLVNLLYDMGDDE